MDPKIFSMYDIRGIYPDQWNKEDAFLLGQAFGTFFQRNKINTIFLGHDNRLSSPEINQEVSKGLLKTGCQVIDLGTVIVPMIYFSWHHFDANATLMITASHNPPQYNGIKSSIQKKAIFADQLQKIREITLKKDFLKGTGKKEKKDIITPYIQLLKEKIHLQKPLKIIIDTGNGTAGPFTSKIFKNIGCQVTSLFAESDGSFPNHQPYPQKPEFYQELKNQLQNNQYDLGLAFDGDGDRIGVYNANGDFIENDVIAAIFAKDICQKHPGAKIVLNVSTTLAVLETIEKHGGQPILWHTGYPFITQKMRETDAVFGGEISGHFFFRDQYYGFDDAIYSALRLLEIIASGKSLNQLIADIPRYHQIPEFRIPVPQNIDKYRLAKKIGQDIEKSHPEAKILNVDGIRFSFENSWGLIRPSNTEPLLSGRAEGKTKKELNKIREIINQKFEKFGIKEKI